MPLGFHCIFDHGPSRAPEADAALVDLVAVPDIGNTGNASWTDPKSGINWIRDLVPSDVTFGRIVLYTHDATAETFFGEGAAQRIQRRAESFVQELVSERKFGGTLRRPIVFICHGLGGVLLKKSLIYSSTRLSPMVAHLRDPFISTLAIMFFGTPHGHTDYTHWSLAQGPSTLKQALPLFNLGHGMRRQDTQAPRNVHYEFLPLLHRFRLFFFWEELPTNLGRDKVFIVPPQCAVPVLDDAESAGIHKCHVEMARFHSKTCSTYRTVIAALQRYCHIAPDIITHRWTAADRTALQYRAEQAWEIGGLEHDASRRSPQESSRNTQGAQHFYPPDKKFSVFIGRKSYLAMLRSKFFPNGQPTRATCRKSFVVYGMGGSGKTELSAEFAHESKHLYAAVFTIRAASNDTVADSLAKIGELAGLQPTEGSGRHFLSRISATYLLIIDNADNPDMDLRALYPTNDAAHILITTRSPNFRLQGELGYIELGGLEQEEALRLLLTQADIPEPWDSETMATGNLIAQTLGYLALALIHAGTCILEKVCSLSKYLEVHKEARERIGKEKMSICASDAEKNICVKLYSSFDVSMNTLETASADLRQDALDLLKILSFYHFENVPIEIFPRAVVWVLSD